MSIRACRGATWWRAWCAMRWPGTIRAAAVAGRGGDAAQAARAYHRGGRRRRHVPPGRRRPRLGAQAALLRRHRATPPLPKGRTRSGCWPTLLHRVSQGPPRLWMAPVQVAFHRARTPLLRRRSSRPAPWLDGSHAGTAVPGAPGATSAPERALGGSPDGGPSGASAGAAGGASAVGFSARAGVPGSPVATAAAEPILGVFPDGGPPDASAGAAAHTTREPVHRRHQSPPRRHIPAAVRRHIWQRDGGRCCYRDPLSGRRCTSSHLLQIDHLLPVAEGGGPEPSNLNLLCAAHHRMRHGYGPAAPPEPPMLCRLRAAGAPLDCAGRQLASGPAGIHFAAPRAQRASSLPPLQTLAGRCRCARATALSWSPVNDSCRFRRSYPRSPLQLAVL